MIDVTERLCLLKGGYKSTVLQKPPYRHPGPLQSICFTVFRLMGHQARCVLMAPMGRLVTYLGVLTVKLVPKGVEKFAFEFAV